MFFCVLCTYCPWKCGDRIFKFAFYSSVHCSTLRILKVPLDTYWMSPKPCPSIHTVCPLYRFPRYILDIPYTVPLDTYWVFSIPCPSIHTECPLYRVLRYILDAPYTVTHFHIHIWDSHSVTLRECNRFFHIGLNLNNISSYMKYSS